MANLVRAVLVLATIVSAAPSQDGLWLPRIFGDHMVLQRGEAPVFGKAPPGAVVAVRASWSDGLVGSVRAGDDGAFRTSITTPLGGGGPFTVKAVITCEELGLNHTVTSEIKGETRD